MDGNDNNNGFVGNQPTDSGTGNQPTTKYKLSDGREFTPEELVRQNEELLASQTRERMKAAEYEKRYGRLDENPPVNPNPANKGTEGAIDPGLQEIVDTLKQAGVADQKTLEEYDRKQEGRIRALMLKTSAERFVDAVNANAKIPELKVKVEDLATAVVQHNFVDQSGNWDFQKAYNFITMDAQLAHKAELDKNFDKGRGVRTSTATNENAVETVPELKDDDSFTEAANKVLDAAGWE